MRISRSAHLLIFLSLETLTFIIRIGYMIFPKKYIHFYTLLTDQTSLSDCLYFLRYWTICILQLLNGIKVRVFFGKKYQKRHLCHHDKNYCYFFKSNIPIINLIAGSRNMIKLSKNMFV